MNTLDSDLRSYQIASDEDELSNSNREIWKLLGIKQGDTALFFPAPNALVPIMFARFMNRRKVTFVDTNEISVSTLIKLAGQMKLPNVTVKLASPHGKFPVADAAFDLVFADFGFSYFMSQTNKTSDPEFIARELARAAKSGGKVAAIEENGAQVMYPCPPEILSIRTKIEAPKAERLIMGRRLYGLFKANALKVVSLRGFSSFLTGEDDLKMNSEINRRITALESQKELISTLGITTQETEKYRAWLKSQTGNKSFLIQFNSILCIAEK